MSRRGAVAAALASAALALPACTSSPGTSAGSSSAGSTTRPAPTSSSPDPAPTASPTSTKPPTKTVRWRDNTAVTHIFYHSLAVDTARAFSASDAQGYKDYMVTRKEFVAQLRQMHQRGYVLVHPQRLFTRRDGRMQPRPLRLPKGKKPLVLSIDDVSYYPYMDGKGFASDLFVDSDGRVRNHYTDAKGKTHVGAYDVSTVLDDFVEKHPDFSYQGDKGTMALTGYEGVLGYRSSLRSHGNTPKTRKAIKDAKVVATALRRDGWRFASHSWGHLNFTESSLSRIKADSQRWDREVRPIVGDTDMLIYPFGADISKMQPYAQDNAKYRYLYDLGFRYFFPVDGTAEHWVQVTDDSVRMARINIDGLSLGRATPGSHSPLLALFDPRETRDPAR